MSHPNISRIEFLKNLDVVEWYWVERDQSHEQTQIVCWAVNKKIDQQIQIVQTKTSNHRIIEFIEWVTLVAVLFLRYISGVISRIQTWGYAVMEPWIQNRPHEWPISKCLWLILLTLLETTLGPLLEESASPRRLSWRRRGVSIRRTRSRPRSMLPKTLRADFDPPLPRSGVSIHRFSSFILRGRQTIPKLI